MEVKPRRFSAHVSRLVVLVRTRDLRLLREYGGVDGVLRALDTGLENGISGDADDLDARRKIFGSNFALSPRRQSLTKGFQLCAQKAIKDPPMVIVVFTTFVSLCFGLGDKFIHVLALVITAAVLNFWPVTLSHPYSAAPSLLDYGAQVAVVRRREWMKIPISRVVVGDVVYLKPGDQVPADGLFIDGHSCELEDVFESKRCEVVGHINPFIFSGNMVAGGYSRMVVTAVGKSCKNQPPKQMLWMMKRHAQELQNLTAIVSRFGKAFALSMFMWLLLRFCVEQNEAGIGVAGGRKKLLIALTEMLATSAIIALNSNLQGLVLALKSALAYSMRSLWNQQVLIKRPALCHQVASVDTICLNKTGTLTSDFTEVEKFWLGLSYIEVEPHNSIAPNVLELLHQAIGLNTSQPRLSSTFAPSLTSTEQAIHKWATSQLGMETERLRQSCTILEIEPFNPVKKMSGVLISKKNAIHVHRKGASDMILPMCSHYYETTGISKPINSTTRVLLEHLVKDMEDGGLRCIAFAHRKTSLEEYFDFSKQKLTLLGLVGLKNPMRSGVIRAVQDCQRAGIEIKLLTGDSTSTAEFMALRCGLLDPDIKQGQVVEGKEFRNFTREERMKKARQIRVLTRATSLDKFLMVECLRMNGRVVAYVGRGQGDVEALKEANVGICFGTECGAEILKSCSDIVIREKKFPLLIEIFKWGRGFYDSIETYTQFLLTATFVDLVVCFVMTSFPSGLTIFYASAAEVQIPVFQLVWVKLILSIAAPFYVLIKQPTDDLMSIPARDPNKPLMTHGMQTSINAQTLYQILVLLAIHFKGKSLLKLNPSEKNIVIFNTYVLCQTFNLINVKLNDRKSIFQEIRNKKWFWGIIVLHMMMVEVWNRIAGTTRLDATHWGLCIYVAASSTAISWLLKYVCPMKIPYLTSAKGSEFKSKTE